MLFNRQFFSINDRFLGADILSDALLLAFGHVRNPLGFRFQLLLDGSLCVNDRSLVVFSRELLGFFAVLGSVSFHGHLLDPVSLEVVLSSFG